MGLPEFRLEAYFARWEFTVPHHLAAADAETLAVRDLLALADPADRRAWDELRLSYTETYGDPGLREAIADTYQRVQPGTWSASPAQRKRCTWRCGYCCRQRTTRWW